MDRVPYQFGNWHKSWFNTIQWQINFGHSYIIYYKIAWNAWSMGYLCTNDGLSGMHPKDSCYGPTVIKETKTQKKRTTGVCCKSFTVVMVYP